MGSIIILTNLSKSVGTRENNLVVSPRMISVEVDEADPFENFFLVAGIKDLGAIEDDFEAITGSERNLVEQSMEHKALRIR